MGDFSMAVSAAFVPPCASSPVKDREAEPTSQLIQ
jgi:hypothetical protein